MDIQLAAGACGSGANSWILVPSRDQPRRSLPHALLSESILPHALLSESILPHALLSESILPHALLSESILPHAQ